MENSNAHNKPGMGGWENFSLNPLVGFGDEKVSTVPRARCRLTRLLLKRTKEKTDGVLLSGTYRNVHKSYVMAG